MSYILDALKRADAERERGHVPGLRTQPLTTDGLVENRGTARPWLLWLGLALIALVLAVAVWWWWTGGSGQAAMEATPEPATNEAPTPVPATPSEAAPVAAPGGPTLPILSPELPRVQPPRAPAPAATPQPSNGATSQAEVKGAPSTSPTTVQATTAAPSAPTATSSSSPSIRSFSELSPEERARLPTVNVSGATYSKNPALRMLIVNGKVSQEGDEVAPGLKLETIEPRTAVLNHQGLRYRIGY